MDERMIELKSRIKENKVLTKNERDYIINILDSYNKIFNEYVERGYATNNEYLINTVLQEDNDALEKENAALKDENARLKQTIAKLIDENTKLQKKVGLSNKQELKVYKRTIRAVATEIGDLHFVSRTKEYPWYDESEFPQNMEQLVEEDKPFRGGWYKYTIEEKFVEI